MIGRLAAIALAQASCLGPLVDDSLAVSPDLLPPGSTVPRADDDLRLAARIRAHQYVDGVVARYAAFGGGAPLAYWDFGPVPPHTASIYVLVDANGNRIDHPAIVGVAPGDTGYSPFWRVRHVPITPAYGGEVIASTTALDDARRLGLVDAPDRTPDVAFAPIVTADVRLAAESGAIAPDGVYHYAGRAVAYFELGTIALDADDRVEVAARYVLRREGGDPINEVMRRVDIVGDGDVLDSNDVLAGITGGRAYTLAFETWHVVVPATTESIDTHRDQTRADHTNASQLFAPDPVPGVVLGYSVEPEVRALVPTSVREDAQ